MRRGATGIPLPQHMRPTHMRLPACMRGHPRRFVVLEGDAKQRMEELTIELCGKLLPEEKAAATLEKLNKKRASTWGKVGEVAHARTCTCTHGRRCQKLPRYMCVQQHTGGLHAGPGLGLAP